MFITCISRAGTKKGSPVGFKPMTPQTPEQCLGDRGFESGAVR